MASPFDQIDRDLLQPAIDSIAGEAITFLPRDPDAEGYTAPGPDPARAQHTTRGVVTTGVARAKLDGGRRGGELQGFTQLTGETVELWLTSAAYAAVGYEILAGDHVRLDGRPGQPVYAIVQANIMDHADPVYQLAPVRL